MKPSIGRIVHYFDSAGCHAAIVTDVNAFCLVNLYMFQSVRSYAGYCPDVKQDETKRLTCTWHWPERVD